MSPLDAQKVVDALANGVDPATGELLSGNHAINSPQVIRALYVASQALEAAARRAEMERHRPDNAGKPWSSAEDQQLLSAFDGGASIRQLAEQHHRSRGAITARLMRFGRLVERAETLDPA
jgi:hypothetical protein